MRLMFFLLLHEQVISAVIWEHVCLGQISHGDQNKDKKDASGNTAEGKEE